METVILLCVVTAALVAFVHLALPRLLAARGVLMCRTRFGITLVFDSTDEDGTPVRLLNVNGTFQSVAYTGDDLWNELACAYHRSFAEVVQMMGGVGRAVVIGGGGYSFPKWLVCHEWDARVEVVEIDPKVTELARRWFFLDRLERMCEGTQRLGLIEGDGWTWLAEAREPYDLVVNDAFSGKRPLGPMGTAEGARIIREKLSDGGVYLANVRASLEGPHARVLTETLAEFSRAFRHVYLLPERSEEPRRVGYNAMVATDRELLALTEHEWRG